MSLKRFYSVIVNLVWGTLVFLLPITSLPILSRLAHGADVAPAAVVPAFILVVVWFIPFVLRSGTLPRETLPFFLFVFIALIASVGALFISTPSFKTSSFWGERAQGILTLFIAVAFYVLAATWHRSLDQVRTTIRLIDLSGFILLGWSCIQAYFVYVRGGHIPGIIFQIQRLISIRDLLLNRISGLTFEPSWLANQLNTLYLPIWLAMTITRNLGFQIPPWKISVENLLLGVAVLVVAISSRIGILSVLLVSGYLIIRLTVFYGRRLHQALFGKFSTRSNKFQGQFISGLLWILILVVVGMVYVGGSIGIVSLLGKVDHRLAHILDGLSPFYFPNLYAYFNHLAFAERFVYWVSGWRIFSRYPLLGVGLGNAGYFFPQVMPSYGWALPEVMDVYIRAAFTPNIKAFWVRLLAETGILGFSAFIAWVYTMWRSSWLSERSSHPMIKAFGWVGQFLLIGFIAEGFSIDTFALPYLWFSLGIVSAVAALYRKMSMEQKTNLPPLETN